MLEILIGCLCLSNIITGVFLFKATRKKPAPEKSLTTDASELLGELIKGGSVIVTQVIDRDSIFQWSPKAQR